MSWNHNLEAKVSSIRTRKKKKMETWFDRNVVHFDMLLMKTSMFKISKSLGQDRAIIVRKIYVYIYKM